MAGTSLSIQQLTKQENTEVYDMPPRIKQESFIPENVKHDSPLNGEYALDLKSPEFDLENIATECSIKYEQVEIVNNSKSEEILPRIKMENVEIDIENMKHRINKAEHSSTEIENFDPFELEDIAAECGIKYEKFEILSNSKSEEILPKIKMEKVEIGMENMEPKIIKAEGIGTEPEDFVPTDFKIKILNKEIMSNNLKKGEDSGTDYENFDPSELEDIATECGIKYEKVEILNTSKSEEILPRIKMEKVEIGIENMEHRINKAERSGTESENFDPFELEDIATEYGIKYEKVEILSNSKSEEILPKIKMEKVEIGIENMEPRNIKAEGNGTEPEDFVPTDFKIKILNKEIISNNLKKGEDSGTDYENFDPSELEDIATECGINYEKVEILSNSKSEEILPKIKMEKVEIGIENMEPRIIKAEGSGTEPEDFDPTDFKIKILNKEIISKNLKKGEMELMKIKNMKTVSRMMIKEEENICDAVNNFSEELSPNVTQNQNVRFNLLSKHHGNNTVNINLNSKSKFDVKKKSKAHKSKNKPFSPKTKISCIKRKTECGTYECPYCGYKCKYDAIFQDHLLSHVNTLNSFSCRICNFKGKNKQNYESHMHIGHDDIKMLKCVSCDYKNTCANQFKLHLTEMGHKVKCPKCDLVFDNSNILKRHLIEHETKIYECSVCKRLMKYKNMKSHLLTHTRAFECEICGYKTSHEKRLKDHMLVHTNEKPFDCQVCKKSFRVEFGLKNHMLSHQNRDSRKLYECSVCKKSYLSHQALKHHFKKKNHGTIGLSMEMEGVLVKRAKIETDEIKNHGTVGLPMEIEGVHVKQAKIETDEIKNHDTVSLPMEIEGVLVKQVKIETDETLL